MQITYERARIEDSLRISILLKTVYLNTYADEGVSNEFSNFIEKRFSPKYISTQINDNKNAIFVALYKNNPVGVAELLVERQCPLRKIPLPELSKLYVLPQFIGTGIGFELIKTSENFLLQNEFKELFLEVYLYNPKAVKFYQRQGYNIIGEVDFPMEENTYRNYVMSKVLNESN